MPYVSNSSTTWQLGMGVHLWYKMKELSMASHVKNGNAVPVPNPDVVDFEVALSAKRPNDLFNLREDFTVGFGLPSVIQVVDLGNLSGVAMIILKYQRTSVYNFPEQFY